MTDLVVVRRELDRGRSEVVESLALIQAFVVTCDADQTFAVEILRDIKGKHAELEKKRTTITVPLNTALREVNALFKPIQQTLEHGERLLKGKIADYQRALVEENARLIVAAAAAETAEEAQEALAATETVVSPQGVGVRTVWKAVVVDECQIPREYLMPDMGKIQEAVGRGEEVPGVKREQMDIVTVRGARA
jgi:hypothetical protein